MQAAGAPSPAAIEEYLGGRPRWVRWLEWLRGRRYRVAAFPDAPAGGEASASPPLIVVAHSARDEPKARAVALSVERDWLRVPEVCRRAYVAILDQAPRIVVIQLRRSNVCGCLGHRHLVVNEAPFAEARAALGGTTVGEMDLAYERIAAWPALPLMDSAWSARFFAGSRRQEFHTQQFRLRLLSVVLHEINHLVFPKEPEESVRNRSLTFYRDALADYVEATSATLSLTIDRSFCRLE